MRCFFQKIIKYNYIFITMTYSVHYDFCFFRPLMPKCGTSIKMERRTPNKVKFKIYLG